MSRDDNGAKGEYNAEYDRLLESYARTEKKGSGTGVGDEIKNHGEIYFSPNSRVKRGSSASPQAVRTVKKNAGDTVSAAGNKEKRKKPRKRKKGNIKQTMLLVLAVFGFVIIASLMLKAPLMGCINDIIAIDASDTDYRVVVGEGMRADDVIDLLANKKLIRNPGFCKLFTDITGYDKDKIYPAGTYFLNSAMGVEGMLYKITHTGKKNTVTLTFPEGFTVSQIIKRLSENGVADEKELYKAMEDKELSEKYTFLSEIKDKEQRYRAFEGYLYPDTYEFYIGEAPKSAIEKLLKNFQDKWNDQYGSRAAELGFSMDEIITVASILQKESYDAKQMPIIASIIYNRLLSSSFPCINCDATGKYIDADKAALQASGNYEKYLNVYDTYKKTGLPVGPICCPGNDAIYAALNPDSTDFYYFLHTPDGKMYTAKTKAEHERNKENLK